MPKTKNTSSDYLEGFDEDGEILVTTDAARTSVSKPIDRWATDAKFYLGVARRTDDHPMAPNPRVITEQVIDQNDENVNELMKILAKARHVFIYGPHGTGKTQLVKYVNAELRRPLYQTQGHEQLEWDDMVGRYNPDEDGNGRWDYGPLVLAMKEGGTYLLDEGVSVRQGILNGLNDVLNSRELTLTGRAGFEKIVPQEGFSVVVTANPWDTYAGNNQMNVAYMDRFMVRRKGYMNQDAERKLLMEKYPSVPAKVVHSLTAFAAALRVSAEASPESDIYVVSTRMLQTVCDSIENFDLDVHDSIEKNIMSIVNLTAPDQIGVLRTHVKNSIKAR